MHDPLKKVPLKKVQWMAAIVSFLVLYSVTENVWGQQEDGFFWNNRFVIKALKPHVDPEMRDIKQVYMCAEARIHQIDMEPAPRAGITKTRVAVRQAKEGSVYLILDDRKPGFRMFQIITRGFILRALAWAGAEHVLLGNISFAGYDFKSDPAFPLHFKLVEDVGYVHLCGRGTVTMPDGTKKQMDYNPDLSELVSALASRNQLEREAACEALGWLARKKEDGDKAVPALTQVLKDNAMEVRRNAAEALGRIGDIRARNALETAVNDPDDWVREVAAHAIKQLDAKSER